MKSRWRFNNLSVLAGCGLCCALILCVAAAGATPSAVAVNAPPEVALDIPAAAVAAHIDTTAASSIVKATPAPAGNAAAFTGSATAASAASATSAATATAAEDVEQHLLGGKPSESHSAGAGLKSGKPTGNGLMGFALPLAAVLALIAIIVWAVKKYLPNVRRLTGSTAMKVVARTHLSPRQSIAVVRLGRRLLVVGQTADSLTPLGVVEDPEEVSELLGEIESGKSTSAVGHFSKVFQKTNDEFAATDEATVNEPADGEIDRVRTELESLTRKVREVTGGSSRVGSRD